MFNKISDDFADYLRDSPHLFQDRFWHKADVKAYSIGKLSDAASAAWRRQMKLHESVELNGAVSPA